MPLNTDRGDDVIDHGWGDDVNYHMGVIKSLNMDGGNDVINHGGDDVIDQGWGDDVIEHRE